MKTVSNEVLVRLRDQRQKRDKIAQELGAMTFSFDEAKARMAAEVSRSVAEETKVASLALRDLGFDIDAANYSVNLVTGEVLCDGIDYADPVLAANDSGGAPQ